MAGVFTLTPQYQPRPRDFVSGGPLILKGIAEGIETAGKMHFAARQKQLDRKASDREMALRSLIKAGHPGAQRELEGMAGVEHADLDSGPSGISEDEARLFDRYKTLGDAAQDPDTQDYYVGKAMSVLGEMPFDAVQTVPGARRPERVEDHNAYLRKEVSKYVGEPSSEEMLGSYLGAERSAPGAVSSAGARSSYQITPETFRLLRKKYRGLPSVAHSALSDPANEGIARQYAETLDQDQRGTLRNMGEPVTKDNLLSMYYTGSPLDQVSPEQDERYGVTQYVRRGEGGGSVVPAESRMAGLIKGRRKWEFGGRAADPYADTQSREQARRDFEAEQGMSPKDQAQYDRGLTQDTRAEQNATNQRYTQRYTRLKEARDRAWEESKFYRNKASGSDDMLGLGEGTSAAEQAKFTRAADRAEQELYRHDAAIDAFNEMWDDGKPLEKINETVERILSPPKKK